MATLVRQQDDLIASNTDLDLENGIPTPFPKDLTQQLLLDELAEEDADLAPASSNGGTRNVSEVPRLNIQVEVDNVRVREIGPSLTQVEQACLMTLNNLLSQDVEQWQPIVPPRRHSLPAQSPTKPGFQSVIQPSPSSSLQTIVHNLRNCYPMDSTSPEEQDDTSLMFELQRRVTSLLDQGIIHPRDVSLVRSLLSLLSHLNKMTSLSSDATHLSPVDMQYPLSTAEIYDTLSRQLAELQSHRDAHSRSESTPAVHKPPIEAVEHAILWHRIDEELDEVLRLCRERAEPIPYGSDYIHPPEYDAEEVGPPTYDPAEYSEAAAAKAAINKAPKSQSVPLLAQGSIDEKMRLDLEAVTMAIDRLYMVAPQLSNQRVELKRSKLDEMEKARINGTAKGKGKEVWINGKVRKERDLRELDSMLELIHKASTRRIDRQSVVLDGEQGMAQRIEKARLRDIEKRTAFQERLITHANSRRLISQDAELRKSTSNSSLRTRLRNPDALLTLPEFIKESMADDIDIQDPNALLTLPEFVRETPPPSVSALAVEPTPSPSPRFKRRPSFKQMRSRSLSAPPLSLSWLLPSPLSSAGKTSPPNGLEPRHSERSTTPSRAGLEVHYVAEYQENLRSVAVFLVVNGTEAGADVEANVISSRDERLILKSGASTSPPLALPARVTPGKKDVRVQSGHFEMKLECTPGQAKSSIAAQQNGDTLGNGLLDSMQLKNLTPTTFICASCSLPLVQASKLSRYDDLPSEYWAELIEAWMCHSDQKLQDRISLYAKGLWPAAGQALVGGSYILFDSTSLMTNNIRPTERTNDLLDDWKPVKCICGAITGRRIEHEGQDGTKSVTYRLAKYAIRPVSPSSDSPKIPLSAFIIQDMDELVQAHATYRFVLLDEEEEKPRILLWLFKPHMTISYAAPNHKLLPRSASVEVAKVHFKVLGPSISPTIKSTLEKYPGFSQSERLVYPMEICRRLAGLLRESNNAYPQGMRVMGGLDVGWFHRV